MKKLKLDVEALAVDSFSTARGEGRNGTVQAHENPSIPPYATCGCTTGASYAAFFCPPPATNNTCEI
jgi:hypothetical protein